jgi:secreted PhoX family phosphatase
MRISRRKFLRMGSAASLALVSTRVLAAPAIIGVKELNVRTLSFDCTNAGEQLNDVDYWVEGDYVPDALAAIDDALQGLSHR